MLAGTAAQSSACVASSGRLARGFDGARGGSVSSVICLRLGLWMAAGAKRMIGARDAASRSIALAGRDALRLRFATSSAAPVKSHGAQCGRIAEAMLIICIDPKCCMSNIFRLRYWELWCVSSHRRGARRPYLAMMMKRADPRHDIQSSSATPYETFGGVSVFGSNAWQLQSADSQTHGEFSMPSATGTHRCELKGRTIRRRPWFSGIGRKRRLTPAAALRTIGVRMAFETETLTRQCAATD